MNPAVPARKVGGSLATRQGEIAASSAAVNAVRQDDSEATNSDFDDDSNPMIARVRANANRNSLYSDVSDASEDRKEPSAPKTAAAALKNAPNNKRLSDVNGGSNTTHRRSRSSDGLGELRRAIDAIGNTDLDLTRPPSTETDDDVTEMYLRRGSNADKSDAHAKKSTSRERTDNNPTIRLRRSMDQLKHVKEDSDTDSDHGDAGYRTRPPLPGGSDQRYDRFAGIANKFKEKAGSAAVVAMERSAGWRTELSVKAKELGKQASSGANIAASAAKSQYSKWKAEDGGRAPELPARPSDRQSPSTPPRGNNNVGDYNKFHSKSTNIFGEPLRSVVERSRVDPNYPIPTIVSRCMKCIEDQGIDEVGIYRLSGSTTTVNNLKSLFSTGNDVDLHRMREDPHAIAGCLKAYLRELPEPLLTNALQPEFNKVFVPFMDEALAKLSPNGANAASPNSQGAEPNYADPELLSQLRALCTRLPIENYVLLAMICKHLSKIASKEEVNKMTIMNLQVIFSPTLSINSALLRIFITQCRTILPMPPPGYNPADYPMPSSNRGRPSPNRLRSPEPSQTPPALPPRDPVISSGPGRQRDRSAPPPTPPRTERSRERLKETNVFDDRPLPPTPASTSSAGSNHLIAEAAKQSAGSDGYRRGGSNPPPINTTQTGGSPSSQHSQHSNNPLSPTSSRKYNMLFAPQQPAGSLSPTSPKSTPTNPFGSTASGISPMTIPPRSASAQPVSPNPQPTSPSSASPTSPKVPHVFSSDDIRKLNLGQAPAKPARSVHPIVSTEEMQKHNPFGQSVDVLLQGGGNQGGGSQGGGRSVVGGNGRWRKEGGGGGGR